MTLKTSSFAQTIAILGTTLLVMACQGESNAQEIDSSKYKPVKNTMKVSTGDKIEVVELFWFGCGHCFALEPSLKAWKKSKPDNVEFVKVPALFSKRWEFHGQAYYTMQALNVPEAAYDAFFERIHVERKPVNTLDSLVTFLAAYDKNEEEITNAFNSFAVDSKMRAAKKITMNSGATGVPAIIVDGKYLTSEQIGGRGMEMFGVVNQLVDKAAAER
jgi:thiol:disulfide interchange protein DsbA